jgi:hypothetical protein
MGSKKSTAIVLRAVHDVNLTATALEFRAEDLKKLAKKTSEEGYRREARAIQADAEAIEQSILPIVREQRTLPLVTPDVLEQEVNAALRIFVTQAFSGLGDPKVQVTPSGVASRRDVLLASLTKRVSLFALDVAEEGYKQGLAARGHTSEALAMTVIGTLRAHGD